MNKLENLIKNRDEAFGEVVDFLEEVKEFKSFSKNIDIINAIIKTAVNYINTYIDTEDALYQEKNKLNLETKTRYYNYIPTSLYDMHIIHMLRPSFQSYKKQNRDRKNFGKKLTSGVNA